ncbi:autotransporter assembly complex protein TamB [Vibrio sp. RC586]|uniref:autotransporter assembly complex protein TamB n=1 Tax=Vibrio sp. RC586 TaxID=675815 RepID=UPI00050CF3A9|nr:translocation/assembly module TamB domain-containing protein [Vibrio sp. RC586]
MIRRALKWTKWFSMLLLALVIILVLALAGALFTNPGLQAVLWGVQQALPQLKVQQAQGALFPRFTLQGVTYSDSELNLTLATQTLSLAMNPNCWLEPSVCINELSISGFSLDLPSLPETEETPIEPDSEPLSEISTPIPIRVGKLALQDIQLNILGHRVAWQQFSTRASWQGNRLRIGQTDWQGIRLALAASEESAAPPANQVATAKQAEPLVLPEVLIPLQIELVRFDIRDFRLEQETPIIVNHLGLEANAAEHQVSISTLELSMPEVDAQLNAEATLTGEYPLQLELNSQVHLADFKGQTLSLSAQGNLADLTLQASLDTLAQAQLNAHFNVLDAALPFDIQLSKVKAQWPMLGESDYQVEVPELSVNGSLANYQYALQGALQGKDIPDVSLAAQGHGNLDEIALQSIKLEALGGSVTGNAVANWKSPLNWAARLNLKNIQPGLQWPQAEGKISGELDTSGSLTEQGGWQIDVSRLAINGILRDYPLKVLGEISASDAKGQGDIELVTKGVSLAHGPNTLTAKGKLTKQWRMSVELDVPDLSKSLPDAHGKIIGDVLLRGDLKQPQVKLLLDADRLQWQDIASIGHVTLQGNLVPLPEPQGDLTLQVRDIEYDSQRIDSVELKAQGAQQKHNVTLDVASPLASTSLALNGRLRLEPSLRWQGELERMWLRSPQGQWLLQQATALSFDQKTERAKVAAHCWIQGNASLCLEEDAELGARGEARLAIKQFDFKQLIDVLPKETKLSGQLDGQVWAKWSPKAAPQLKANLALSQGQVTQKLDKSITLGWDKAQFSAEIAKNQLQASWLLDVTDNGDLSGNIKIADVRAEQKTMLGSLNLTTFNLDFLQPLIGEYSEAKSSINADVQFHGPMLHPQLNGEIAINDIRVKGEISPVDVQSGQVSLKFNGYQAVLNADIQTTDGLLEVDGDANWQQLEDWRVKARIHAPSMTVDLPPMVKVKVIPDLTLIMQPKLARVVGNIALPWGRIVVEELPPSAIGVSKDQVLLNADLQPLSEKESLPFTVETDVNVQIGDDFQLSAFGLQGNLVGRLNVAQKDKGPFILGEVNIRNGQYRSFGQDLQIKEGKILMNGPADQPYLAITAIRNPDNTQDNVIAGVRVSGPSDEPSLVIFSEPAMPQANALSYLLRGQNIDGEAGGNAMTTTLIGLSLARSGKLVGEIGQAFGVQDLQLDTAGSGDDSQVTVSGYILPGLQVKYGVGIFNSVGEFTVRYRLMQDLYLEAVSGVDSAVDLLYQFEFN